MSLYKGNNLISGAMPNSANQSLSNLDSAGQDKFDAKVNKSGDTMTGDLTIRPDSSPHIYLQNSNFTKGTNPSSNIYWEYRAEDSNTNPAEWYTNRVGNFRVVAFPDGTISTQMLAHPNDPNSNASAVMQTQITSAGVASCSFPNTTCCDGQWVKIQQHIINSSTSLKGSSDLSYTVNIPSSGGYYEVLIYGEVETGTTSGNYVAGKVSGDKFGSVSIGGCRTRTASSVMASGSGTVLVNSSTRKIIVARNSNWEGHCNYLIAVAYRRVGTNA